MKCESTGDIELTSSGSSSEEMTKSSPSSDSFTKFNPQKICKPISSESLSPAEGSEEQATENDDEEENILENFPINLKISSLSSSPEEGQSSSATLTPPDLSSLSITASNTRKTVGVGSYLLSDRVRVYTSIPDTALPEGTVLLPIDDCKWVAVSLEFPNQKVKYYLHASTVISEV